jgi:hypothetical protein
MAWGKMFGGVGKAVGAVAGGMMKPMVGKSGGLAGGGGAMANVKRTVAGGLGKRMSGSISKGAARLSRGR